MSRQAIRMQRAAFNGSSGTTPGGGGDTTAPSAPSSLAVGSVTATSISLSWDAATDDVGVVGYNVYREGAKVGTPTDINYTDSGLTASTNYSYYVTAVDAGSNESVRSNIVSATTESVGGDTTKPSAPTNLVAAVNSSSSISLSWDAATDNVGVVGYTVFRNGTKKGTPSELSYVDNGLTAGTSYNYYVTARDAAGNQSAHSTTVIATTSSSSTTRPSSPIIGFSAGVPTAQNTPSELDPYRGLSKYQLVDYIQNEFAGLAGLPHSNANPLFKAYHGYDSGGSVPSDFTTSAMSGCASRNLIAVHSMHADNQSLISGNENSNIDAYVASCPADRPTYALINREPEGESNFDPAQWRNGAAHFCQRVLQSRGSKPVIPGVCLINWSLHPNNKSFDHNSVNPAPEMLALGVDLDEVVYTTDGYDTSPIKLGGAQNLYAPTSALAKSWGFNRFGASEVACKSYISADRSVAAAWIRELADLAATNQFEYLMWFNSGVGNRAGTEGWYIYGDANKVEWANVGAHVYP